jgi:carboxyl-terminal processing protease
MNPRVLIRQRPIPLGILLLLAFLGGILVTRAERWIAPFQYPPSGVENTFAPFWETWHLVNKHYVKREAIQPERMTRGAIRGLLASLGDFGHTRFVTPEELKELRDSLEGNMEGIGARMSLRNDLPTIVSTLPDSPARKAGLQAGDVLLEVDGTHAGSLSLDQIVHRVRGPKGTTVHLRVARESQSEPLEFTIARAKVEVPDVTWAMLPGVPIAHVAIQNFGKEADAQVKAALHALRERGARGLILDVRGNPGGLKDQAVAVSSEFLTSGNVFLEQDAQGNRTAVPVKPGGEAPEIPVCLLIDQGTASSAEIFAGALQDHGRGKLIGARTIGTGTVLQPYGLTDGSAVLLAIAEWLTPEGRQIWNKGITPDISVALPPQAHVLQPELEANLTAESLARSDDKQLLKALEVLKAQLPKAEASKK